MNEPQNTFSCRQYDLFALYAGNLEYFSDRLAWDDINSLLLVGVTKKALALAWQEYLLCQNICHRVCVRESEALTTTAKFRYELAAKCTRAEGDRIRQLLAGKDLSSAPPEDIGRLVSDFKVGNVVKILYFRGGNDSRIGMVAVVNKLEPRLNSIAVTPEKLNVITWLKPAWAIVIGAGDPLANVQWEIADKVALVEHHLFVDGRRTEFYIAKPKVRSYATSTFGMPPECNYVVFRGTQVLGFSKNFSEAKGLIIFELGDL